MGKDIGKGRASRMMWGSLLENLAIIILAFYPLRHIGLGLDFWDTGYEYANFQYMGVQYENPMWLFSTYLSHAMGNLLTRLPRADTLLGMNLYTGLFVSVLALGGYFFCIRILRMPKAVAFVGEMIAVSLCWSPTALLRNYLTYVVFLAASVSLYLGLTKERRGCLVFAGVLLGTNVLVRFPNLAEAAMILAVWAYDFIVWMEDRYLTGASAKKAKASGRQNDVSGVRTGVSGFWRRTVQHTLWCLLGDAAALAALFLFIHIRYGITEYIAGIRQLFAMTDNAADYRATSMIMGIVGGYVKELYWVSRMGVIAAGGLVLFAVAGGLEAELGRKVSDGKIGNMLLTAKAIHVGVRIIWVVGSIAMIVWLCVRGFCSLLFYSYDPIVNPGTVFLMLAMSIAVVRIFHRDSPKEEKLISGMLVLIILLTPIGSNNGTLPSLNNLFLAAPYTLWESWRFVRYVGDAKIGAGRKGKGGIVLSAFPLKGILTAFLALCLFQFGGFGVCFAFAEATGIQNATTAVDNNAVLKGVKMSPEKAQWMTELSDYVRENGLQGRGVALYGYIPALSYYLQMPAALNLWSDLASYRMEVMREDVSRLEEQIADKSVEKPVVILENAYALYLEARDGTSEAAGISEEKRQALADDPKWKLLIEFMDSVGYEQTFRNEKFAVYR